MLEVATDVVALPDAPHRGNQPDRLIRLDHQIPPRSDNPHRFRPSRPRHLPDVPSDPRVRRTGLANSRPDRIRAAMSLDSLERGEEVVASAWARSQRSVSVLLGCIAPGFGSAYARSNEGVGCCVGGRVHRRCVDGELRGARARGEVTCCSYVVYETEAEGPVTAPLVTFRSLGQAADATARISSDAVRLRDGNAPLRAPSQSCGGSLRTRWSALTPPKAIPPAAGGGCGWWGLEDGIVSSSSRSAMLETSWWTCTAMAAQIR